jgi:methyl-accepting chemotaxis protein
MLDRFLSANVADAELARKGRMLSGMLLSIVALVLIYLLLAWIFSGTLSIPVFSVLMIGAALGFYLLTRRGYVTVSAAGLVGAVVLILTGGTMVPEASNLSVLMTPPLLALPIILTGVLITWRWVLPVSLLACLDTVWLYNAGAPSLQPYRAEHPDDMIIFTLGTVILLFGAGILGAISSRQVEQALTTLRRQNQDLLSANQDLARQRQQADVLGASIGSLAAHLSQVSARQIHGVSTQAQSINQVVSAATELHLTADQIAALGQQVRQAADMTMANVQRGQEILLRSGEAVQRNRAQVQTVIARMTALETVTARITAFVDSIRELSEETHLLALNATIEAAGAGALGRRFGVVATEVRSLSTRANEIVDQIRLLIGELEQAGRVTLAATQDTSAVVQDVEVSAAEVRDTQDQVVQAAQRTNELVQLISTATRQQMSATEQMTYTMQQIAAVSDATSHDASALAQVVRDLLHTAEQLNPAAPPAVDGRLTPA